MPAETCSICDRALDLHNRHVRFTLPDPVVDTPANELAAGSWMSHASARESVMMQVPNLGAFVRALLPVALQDGYRVTFGVWVGIHPAELRSVFDAWWRPEYRDLRLTGRLANAIPPWGLLASPVDAEVHDDQHTPYCHRSDDPLLDRVLHDEWPHTLVLDALTGSGRPGCGE